MAGDELKMQLQGIDAMTKNLAQLGTRVAARGPSTAVRAAGAVIIREMRMRAPKATGSLKKSIGQKVKNYKRSGTVASIIGARSKSYATAQGKRNPAYYAHLVEFGVKPHATGKKKSFYRRGTGQHPGHRAQTFMRPAWDSAAPRARSAVIDKMTQVFDKESKALSVK